MSRPFRTTTALLFIVAALNFAGCKTIYTDTYAWKRNHYKPLKESTREKDLLPPPLPSVPSNDAPPPLPGGPAPEPAPALEPAPMAPAPVPGL